MAYFDANGRICAYDNVAAGAVTGQENLQGGSGADSHACPPLQYINACKEAPASTVSVSALSRSGTTATATATAHGLAVGQVVILSGATELAYNHAFRVDTVADADTFTFAVQGSPTSPAGGTIACQPLSRASKLGTGSGDFSPTPEDVAN